MFEMIIPKLGRPASFGEFLFPFNHFTLSEKDLIIMRLESCSKAFRAGSILLIVQELIINLIAHPVASSRALVIQWPGLLFF